MTWSAQPPLGGRLVDDNQRVRCNGGAKSTQAEVSSRARVPFVTLGFTDLFEHSPCPSSATPLTDGSPMDAFHSSWYNRYTQLHNVDHDASPVVHPFHEEEQAPPQQEPESGLCRGISKTPTFQMMVFVVIVLNTLTCAVEAHLLPRSHAGSPHTGNHARTCWLPGSGWSGPFHKGIDPITWPFNCHFISSEG